MQDEPDSRPRNAVPVRSPRLFFPSFLFFLVADAAPPPGRTTAGVGNSLEAPGLPPERMPLCRPTPIILIHRAPLLVPRRYLVFTDWRSHLPAPRLLLPIYRTLITIIRNLRFVRLRTFFFPFLFIYLFLFSFGWRLHAEWDMQSLLSLHLTISLVFIFYFYCRIRVGNTTNFRKPE